MFFPALHLPLRPLAWNAGEAEAEIGEIVADAMAAFDAERFWPAHRLEDGVPDGNTSFYIGATGMIWALSYLKRVGATQAAIDFRSVLPHLLEANKAEFGAGIYTEHGSLLFGDLGTALVVMQLAPSNEIAELVFRTAAANTPLPIRELMWGLPGSMIACLHMATLTGELRWRELFAAQAARLLSELEESAEGPLWTQDLYGSHLRLLGAVHGFAGNMIPLLRGWDWLDDGQRTRVADAGTRTLALTAFRSEAGANWNDIAVKEPPPRLCQHCHGAAGMVTSFADAPFSTPDFEALLGEGAKLIWTAGPLAKGHGLCHGTAGNGYAFLKLHRRTGDAIWLERARAFAMTAIAQCRASRDAYGRGRYTLWTGDIGLALYLWDCLTEDAGFPSIDRL
jgi:hypothetical protein